MCAMSSKGTSKMSCRTNAIRSAGLSRLSTTSIASPTELANSASSCGIRSSSAAPSQSGVKLSSDSSRRACRARSRLRQTRLTTVVSQAAKFSTSDRSVRSNRSQASWTALSASAMEPSIR